VKWKIPARQKAASGSYKRSDAKKVSQWLVQVQGRIHEFGERTDWVGQQDTAPTAVVAFYRRFSRR